MQCKQSNEINVTIKDLVLTPLTCASLVNEMFKVLMYQKSQIPYPYNWLKHTVKRKRENEDSQEGKTKNLTAERNYHIASTAYDVIENMMENICTEFKTCPHNINEILIIFGSIPTLPTEVFTIRIPALVTDHYERNHWLNSSKNQHKVLRDIILSEDWMRAMQDTVPTTNVYIMIQKYLRSPNPLEENDFFLPKRHYELPPNVRNTVINLISDNQSLNCCGNLSVYEKSYEEPSTYSRNSYNEISSDSTDEYLWFQGKDVMKGFKDCYIDHISVSDLW